MHDSVAATLPVQASSETPVVSVADPVSRATPLDAARDQVNLSFSAAAGQLSNSVMETQAARFSFWFQLRRQVVAAIDQNMPRISFCETCGQDVSKFTIEHLEAHFQMCPTPNPATFVAVSTVLPDTAVNQVSNLMAADGQQVLNGSSQPSNNPLAGLLSHPELPSAGAPDPNFATRYQDLKVESVSQTEPSPAAPFSTVSLPPLQHPGHF